MEKVIIDTDTRIIKRFTTNDDPAISGGETAIPLDEPITMQPGFWKLDLNGKLMEATQAEIDAAGVDEKREGELRNARWVEVTNAIDNIINNSTKEDFYDQLIRYFTCLRDASR